MGLYCLNCQERAIEDGTCTNCGWVLVTRFSGEQ
jgi:hypothetical protein